MITLQLGDQVAITYPNGEAKIYLIQGTAMDQIFLQPVNKKEEPITISKVKLNKLQSWK